MQILGIPLIVAIVYGIIELIKITFQSENLNKFFPLIAGILGIGFGVTAFYLAPNVILANNFLEAILIGLVSGLTATGSSQVIIQMRKFIEIKNNY